METSLNNVSGKVAKTVQKGAEKGKDVLNSVSREAQEMRLQSVYESAKAQAQDAIDASEDFVKKYPLYTVAGIAAVGLLAGILIARSRR